MVANPCALEPEKHLGVYCTSDFQNLHALGFYIPDARYNQISLKSPIRLSEIRLHPSSKKFPVPVLCPSAKILKRGESLCLEKTKTHHNWQAVVETKVKRGEETLINKFVREKDTSKPMVILQSKHNSDTTLSGLPF